MCMHECAHTQGKGYYLSQQFKSSQKLNYGYQKTQIHSGSQVLHFIPLKAKIDEVPR